MNKITLPKGYHNFADKRRLVGLPNAMNVLSNFIHYYTSYIFTETQDRK